MFPNIGRKISSIYRSILVQLSFGPNVIATRRQDNEDAKKNEPSQSMDLLRDFVLSLSLDDTIGNKTRPKGTLRKKTFLHPIYSVITAPNAGPVAIAR